MNCVLPPTIVIERNMKLYAGLKESFGSETNVLFCYFHILKTLKTQYAFLENERPEEYKMLVDLPIVDSVEEFEKLLTKVEQFRYTNEYHRLIV